ncbi:MAG: HD domain-containing protein, partial [Atribacterota bacterium]
YSFIMGDKISCIIEQEKANVDYHVLSEIPILQSKKSYNLKKISQSANISLTPGEAKLFDFLVKAKNSNPKTANVELRVAGGWTRDKLLGEQSDDIDIALSGMTGQEFVNTLNFQDQSKSNIIESNPEKSKHLETVKVSDLFGYEIDFVNLRSESYSEDSRIPEAKITDNPAEDALRRDLTINALFYNIETNQVEDYVGGLKDLKNMILKTPLDPEQTFIDDPLRMLRVLRFYSKYPKSTVDDEIIEAMSKSHVQEAYEKLATERSMKEIKKMMGGEQPVDAARILLKTGLYRKVFKIPEDWHPIDMDQQTPFHDLTLMDHTLKVMENYENMASRLGVSNDEKGLMLLSSLLHDFGKMNPEIRQPKMDKKTGKPVVFERGGEEIERRRYIGHDKASADFAKDILTQMGFNSQDKKFITTIIANHMTPHSFKGALKPKNMGKFISKTHELYKHVLYHGAADSLAKEEISEEERQEIEQNLQAQEKAISEYQQQMGNRITETMIDGNRIQEIVQKIEPEIAQNNAFIDVKWSNRPIHYMSYLKRRLLEAQWTQKVSTQEEAEKWITGEIKQFGNLWRQQQSQKAQEQQRMQQEELNSNAEGKSITIKESWSTGDSVDGGYRYEGAKERIEGIRFLERSVPSKFKVGRKIRLDIGGWGNEPIHGKIISRKDNRIIVEFTTGRYKGKRKGFDLLEDTASLAKLTVL